MNTDALDEQQTKLLKDLSHLKLPGLKEYKIDKLLFNSTRNCILYDHFTVLKECTKRIIGSIYRIRFNLQGKKLLLISYKYERKDHAEIWDSFKNLFHDFDEIEIENKNFSIDSLKSVMKVVHSVKYWILYIEFLKAIPTLRARMLLSAYLVELQEIDKLICSHRLDCVVAVTYFDGGFYENLIIQYLKRRNVKTITLQHGQPIFHGFNVDRINQTMILNFTSNYIAVTGEFSKKQFLMGGIPDESIKVLGSLRPIKPYSQKSSHCFSVFLDCPTINFAENSNRLLLEMAEELAESINYLYVVRIHPSDDVNRYKNFHTKYGEFCSSDKSISEMLEQIEFSILHASGVYLDILSNGIKCFCMSCSDAFVSLPTDADKFKTINDLLYKINEWDKLSDTEKKVYINNVVKYYLSPENSNQRYVDFINSLILENIS